MIFLNKGDAGEMDAEVSIQDRRDFGELQSEAPVMSG